MFVESVKGAGNKDPVTLWLNGGPGCSSMLGSPLAYAGFIQEIGPCYLPDGVDYKENDTLKVNPYSWHTVSNLLFLESPAGVGYSYNLDASLQFNDSLVATDSIKALVDFFTKFREYSNNDFWLAGESYAGKYIPDLAVEIDKYNRGNPIITINLRGQLVGNGVFTFEGGELQISQTDFMVNHEFVDPDLTLYWTKSCHLDPYSAGCRYFRQRYDDNVWELNPYSVYDFCYTNDSFMAEPSRPRGTQQSILNNIVGKFRPVNHSQPLTVTASGRRNLKYNDPTCAYFDGLHSYFNLNEEAFHAKWKGQQWNGPCADNVTSNYHIGLRGSMDSYRYLLNKISTLYKIVVYSGDWDSVVPYLDTVKNLKRLNLIENPT